MPGVVGELKEAMTRFLYLLLDSQRPLAFRFLWLLCRRIHPADFKQKSMQCI